MKKARQLMVMLLVSLGLGACAHGPSRTQLGTLSGAVVGGTVGNSLFDGGAVGTIGGAAAGALIGQEMTRPHRHRYR